MCFISLAAKYAVQPHAAMIPWQHFQCLLNCWQYTVYVNNTNTTTVAFPWQQCFRERATMLRYMYIAFPINMAGAKYATLLNTTLVIRHHLLCTCLCCCYVYRSHITGTHTPVTITSLFYHRERHELLIPHTHTQSNIVLPPRYTTSIRTGQLSAC